MTLYSEYIPVVTQLRHALFDCAEISGRELRTYRLLTSFLQEHTSLEIFPCGNGFYAAHKEASPTKPAIALRADYDALAMPDGSAKHLCGHDGHAAALCGAALWAEKKTFDRNIFFLFQPAEETGAGASRCCELFERETVDEIYGLHNLPGVPLGQVTTRPGTFACASRGLILSFHGKPTHAAYPENGISPAAAMGELLGALPVLSAPDQYTGMTLCTVIGMLMGEKAFGAAAADAEVWLTLRAEHDCDLSGLYDSILQLSQKLAMKYSLTFSHELQDVFPATKNAPACAQKVLDLCQGTLLETPMRWSEDFGHYLKKCPGAFFGIGAGETHPPLHTENYEYPDALLPYAMEAFAALMKA